MSEIKRTNKTSTEEKELYEQLLKKVENHETIKVKFVNGEEVEEGEIKL